MCYHIQCLGDGSWSIGLETIHLPLPLDSGVDDFLQHSRVGFGGWCQQHLGFGIGLAIASTNMNGLYGHLDEVELLPNSLGIHCLALNEKA